MENIFAKIVSELKEYVKKAGISKAVLGLSGGVDSALVAKLGVLAFGKENVTALIMPNEGVNNPKNTADAESWAKELGIEYYVININPFVSAYEKLPWKSSEIARINIQARVRMTILYHYANTHGAMVLGTGNKTELLLGYFTKYGDGGVDVLPIGGLYKTDVWKMAEELGIPEAILKKAPSADLFSGQTDEGEIGMQYPDMDRILKKFEKSEKPSDEAEEKLHERMMANKHKVKMAPVIMFDL